MATKHRFWWRSNVERALREYPKLKDKKNALQAASVTPNYNPMPGSSEPSRTTENLAMAQLPEEEENWIRAIDRAIEETMGASDGDEVLKLVIMIFFRETHTLTGAAEFLFISPSTAKRRIGRFIWLVAKHKGLV